MLVNMNQLYKPLYFLNNSLMESMESSLIIALFVVKEKSLSSKNIIYMSENIIYRKIISVNIIGEILP